MENWARSGVSPAGGRSPGERRMEESGLSQEVVLNFLLEAGGKVENSKLLLHFRNELAQSDPQLKKEARELFKSLINKVAVVREEEGVKYVVLKKKMQPLVAARPAVPAPGGGELREEAAKALGKGESLGNLVEADDRGREAGGRRNSAPSALSPSESRILASRSGHPQNSAGSPAKPGGAVVPQRQGDRAQLHSALPAAGSGSPEQIREKSCVTDDNLPSERRDPGLRSEGLSGSRGPKPPVAVTASDKVADPERLDAPPPLGERNGNTSHPNIAAKSIDVTKTASAQKPKPYMHPLRLPPGTEKRDPSPNEPRKPADEVPVDNNGPADIGNQDAPNIAKVKRSQPAEVDCSSPHLKRASRVLKFPEDARFSDQVPLDPMEHEWIVRTALGHWTQVSGLLLKDSYLAEKKDFMSGFTAVHWAAKFGNSEIMCWIIDNMEKNGIKMDINSKSHGGYTPLHIAAIHGRENVIIELVGRYDAKTTLRDYSGKRPYHYLTKDNSYAVRHLLGDPETLISESISHKRGSKVASSILSGTMLGVLADDIIFQEFSKSLKKPTNFSKFFTAPAGHKKRAKMRTNFASLDEEPEEEREEIVLKRRPVTEIFF
ncbi:ankyrin repeat domain-containing protein SOWAHA-like [Narcine bancroftii]|uniref:ankyrin repeat domain-containing protein SOWAHA-like n=1 Tax=Narcine bancroftii TaxID=1343680 RepID=UPI003831DD3F